MTLVDVTRRKRKPPWLGEPKAVKSREASLLPCLSKSHKGWYSLLKSEIPGLSTRALLRCWVHYNPATGIFTWQRTTRWQKAGERADRLRRSTDSPNYYYRSVSIQKKRYQAHVLAWFYMTGEWRFPEIDHKDTDATNNKWSNLRLATRSQNAANTRLRENNTSGYKGISWSSTRKRWCAYINFQGKRIPLGRYKNKQDAVLIRQAKALELFGEFARHA